MNNERVEVVSVIGLRRNQYITIFYIISQLALYISFLTLDILNQYGNYSNYIKLLIVVLCCIYVWLQKVDHMNAKENRRYLSCIRGAMLFTLLADIFIIALNKNYEGVLSFIVVQQIYGYMLIKEGEAYQKRNTKIWVRILRRIVGQLIGTALICVLLAFYTETIDSLLIVSVYYLISIVWNVIFGISIAFLIPSKRHIIYATAMVLFLLCDINVGIFNLASFISIPQSIYSNIYPLASILMWTFYAPSQVLIGISTQMSCNYRQKTM